MKIIVLGLDGATLDLILPGVEQGELPGFARLMREGTWGTLRSTVPPDSPSAWTTFATGVNPGRHGVFGFMARRPDSYDYEIGASVLCRAPTLWERASLHGRRVGVINVPFTYPPKAVNGFLVAGMMTPDLKSPFTHPPELRDELLRAIPDYSIGHGLGRARGGDPRAILVRQYASSISARERAMQWLAKKYNPDLLICVFTVLDRLQHFLWADMDERHPNHNSSSPSEYREAIRAAYRQLDGVVAQTLDVAGGEALVVVLSDHGFEGVARTFYVNAWLAERGLLALTGRRGEPRAWANRAARLARHALAFLPGGEEWREKLRARRLISDAFVKAIDWSRTRAWFGLDRGVWLNVEGRDPLGMVKPGGEYERLRSQLIAELESLEDRETHHRIVRKVHRRETLYRGDDLSRAPDLIIEPARHADDLRGRFILSERLVVPPSGGPVGFVGPSAPISGYHKPDGVVLFWGKGVPANARLNKAEMGDVAPTIVQAMDVPGSEELEGKALIHFGRRDTPVPHNLPGKSVGFRTQEEGPKISEDERRRIEQQLKNLGYLD
jgi:predicted AlkP superfamily phosphohydrolase/phosphomutase